MFSVVFLFLSLNCCCWISSLRSSSWTNPFSRYLQGLLVMTSLCTRRGNNKEIISSGGLAFTSVIGAPSSQIFKVLHDATCGESFSTCSPLNCPFVMSQCQRYLTSICDDIRPRPHGLAPPPEAALKQVGFLSNLLSCSAGQKKLCDWSEVGTVRPIIASPHFSSSKTGISIFAAAKFPERLRNIPNPTARRLPLTPPPLPPGRWPRPLLLPLFSPCLQPHVRPHKAAPSCCPAAPGDSVPPLLLLCCCCCVPAHRLHSETLRYDGDAAQLARRAASDWSCSEEVSERERERTGRKERRKEQCSAVDWTKE